MKLYFIEGLTCIPAQTVFFPISLPRPKSGTPVSSGIKRFTSLICSDLQIFVPVGGEGVREGII